MKLKTRKLIFTALAAILASLILTCIPFGPLDNYEDFQLPEFTNVEYSQDGKSITIYLDGSMPVRQSRAINLKWAQIGYDFFEVAFLYGSTVARATWETGHAAGVNGVARGVDYASAVPAAGQGAAILFVGKKSDKTLLAFGILTGTSDTEGGPTFVGTGTKSVTFTVAALDIGANFGAGESSFLTAAQDGSKTNDVQAGNTEILPVMIGRQLFPLYRFNRQAIVNQNVNANYTFKVVPDPDTVRNITIDTFRGGILQAGPATLVVLAPNGYHLEPRYPLGDGGWATSNLLVKDDTTIIENVYGTFNNPGFTAPNGISPFLNPVEFLFRTLAANNGKIFAFSFQVPVYPLTNIDGRRTGAMWYLRPGYDSYLYDLDDGKGGTGGALLIGTGELGDSLSFNLKVEPPIKSVYSPATGYDFDLEGIKVNLRVGNDEISYIHENLLSIPPDTFVNKPVKFYIGTGANKTEIFMDEDLEKYLIIQTGPNAGQPDPRFVSDD